MKTRDNNGRFTSNITGDNNYNWKGGMVKVKCSYCNKPLLRHPNRLKRTKNHFCNIKCKGSWQNGNPNFVRESHPNWKGGKRVDKAGYIMVLKPEHHRARHNRYVCEHILVAENKYGRKIMVGEHIHHVNGIKDDNRPENLFLTTNSEHDKFSYIHAMQDRIRELEKV